MLRPILEQTKLLKGKELHVRLNVGLQLVPDFTIENLLLDAQPADESREDVVV